MRISRAPQKCYILSARKCLYIILLLGQILFWRLYYYYYYLSSFITLTIWLCFMLFFPSLSFCSARLLYLVCSKNNSHFSNGIISRFTSRNRLTRRLIWISYWISNTGILYFILHNSSIIEKYTHFEIVCMIMYKIHCDFQIFHVSRSRLWNWYITLNGWIETRWTFLKENTRIWVVN